MNKRKILILLVLFVAISGLTVTSVDAATYKKTINFKDRNSEVTKYVGNGDYLSAYYWSKLPQSWGKKMQLSIHSWDGIEANSHKITTAKVKFKKTNSKATYTKTFKANKWGNIMYNPKSGYKPLSAIVTYKDT